MLGKSVSESRRFRMSKQYRAYWTGCKSELVRRLAMTGFWVFMLIMCLLTPVWWLDLENFSWKAGQNRLMMRLNIEQRDLWKIRKPGDLLINTAVKYGFIVDWLYYRYQLRRCYSFTEKVWTWQALLDWLSSLHRWLSWSALSRLLKQH